MKLNNLELKELCEVAKEAALKAGDIIINAHQSQKNVNIKVAGENIASQVVTEIDLKAQEIILNTLNITLKKFDIGLLTEEANDDGSRFVKDYFWCIDPLDGTLAFSRNKEGYSVSIALIRKDGTPIIGVVYNPKNDHLYSAIKDQGAFKNNKEFKVESKYSYLTLLYDQSFLKRKDYTNEITKLEKKATKLGLNGIKHYHLGGAVMNGICTVEMAPALYYKHPKTTTGGGSIWDFAASSVIQSEAGGINSNYFGGLLDLNRKDSTFMNHEGVFFRSDSSITI